MTSVSGAKSGTLSYDPYGRLYQVVSNGVTTRFAYDGDALVQELNGSNQMLRRYVHGPGVDQPLLWYEGSGTGNRRHLIADRLGSIIAVSTSASNLHLNSYDTYGIPDAGNLGRFSYTGQTYLPEIGLMYYKARMYNPYIGRFMQVDPIGYADQQNLYAYVGNDPLNLVDPSGTQTEDPRLGIGGNGDPNPVDLTDSDSVKKNPSRIKGTVTYGGLAGLGIWVVGSEAHRYAIRNPGDSVGSQLYSQVARRANSLDTRHREAALREARGEVVAYRKDGTPFDHINEIVETSEGLSQDIRAAKALVNHPNTPIGVRLKARAALRQASRLQGIAKRTLEKVDRIQTGRTQAGAGGAAGAAGAAGASSGSGTPTEERK